MLFRSMRLGDSYFVSSNYKLALSSYNKASKVNGPERDYAAFQKAMSQGFLGNSTSKIDGISQFVSRYPKSSLRDDALFELGNTYVKTNREAMGLQTYENLIKTFPKSKFAPQAQLRQGLVHYNASRNERALEKLKGVVSTYPKSQEAQQAVSTIKLVYVDMGKVSEYAAWARNVDIVEVSDSELDDASFEAAQRK